MVHCVVLGTYACIHCVINYAYVNYVIILIRQLAVFGYVRRLPVVVPAHTVWCQDTSDPGHFGSKTFRH